ncbi:MAG: hypothetical protein JJU36_06760 [Phycisphaeraceae bacterium]|nr:hypothetical protein [Phycisphaeraceae bacterium]
MASNFGLVILQEVPGQCTFIHMDTEACRQYLAGLSPRDNLKLFDHA